MAVKARLRVFAGPNGSGKSTILKNLDPEWIGCYVNADEIEKSLHDPDEAASPGFSPGFERSGRRGLLLLDVLTQDADWCACARRSEVAVAGGPEHASPLNSTRVASKSRTPTAGCDPGPPYIFRSMEAIKTLKLRIKDKHASVLGRMAREVNQVWNFVNETSSRAIGERHKWLSAFDLQKLTAGFSKCDDVLVGSTTTQQVCEEYAIRRKQFKKARLNWRVSNPKSAKRSLGWVPFKQGAAKYKAGQIVFAGHKLSLWDSYGLGNYELRAGSFSQDARGRWFLNVCVKVEAAASAGTEAFGIDLGLKTCATVSDGSQLVGRWARATESKLKKVQRAGAGRRSAKPLCKPRRRRRSMGAGSRRRACVPARRSRCASCTRRCAISVRTQCISSARSWWPQAARCSWETSPARRW